LAWQGLTALCQVISIMLGQDPQFLSPAFSYETYSTSIGVDEVLILEEDLNRVWVQFSHGTFGSEPLKLWFQGQSRIAYDIYLGSADIKTLKYSDVGTICGGEFYCKTWYGNPGVSVDINFVTLSFFPHRLTDD